MKVKIEYDTLLSNDKVLIWLDGILRKDITKLVFIAKGGKIPALTLNFGKDPYDED